METTVEVTEGSQVGQARRVAADVARAQLLTEDECGRLALVVTEMATNLVKYGSRGSITLRPCGEALMPGVEIIASDHGPGVQDLAGSMRDGHSTGGSLGLGLGTIQRIASFFDVYTVTGQGTVVVARVDHGKPSREPLAPPRFLSSARAIPKLGQIESGDAWRLRDFGNHCLICIVDGLGHGPLAAMAARRALDAFDGAHATDEPAKIVLHLHSQLKDTRGVVAGVLAIDRDRSQAVYCGVGNINALVVNEDKSHHLASIDGIVGYNVRKVRSQQVGWSRGAVAILHTDGLSAKWGMRQYPGLATRHPSLIASVLFRDHARATDDATVLVVRGS